MAQFFKEKFLKRNIQKEKASKATVETKIKKEITKEWITFYRRNWNIYAERVLGIKLKPFQHIMLYLIGTNDVFFAICSRGLSKSFIVGLAMLIHMQLYPHAEGIITASTISQANKLAEKKMRDELIKKLSPYLQYMYENEYIVVTKSDDGYKLENTLNRSTSLVLPCLDSSRGSRATLLVYEECRLLKKGMIDGVFEKMAHPRQAIFLKNEQYNNSNRWVEECKSVYITSARLKSMWFWRTFKDCVTGYYQDKRIKYAVFGADIFVAMDSGFKTAVDFHKGKTGDELEHRMEDLNEMLGEAENAYFTLDSFQRGQVIEKPFIPPNVGDIVLGNDLGNFPKRSDSEVRVVTADFAFANTTTNQKNDATSIQLISGHWKNGKFERRWEYLVSHEASDSLGAARRVRELFWDFDCDYIVLDLRNGGEVLYNSLTEVWEHPERGSYWNKSGLTVSNRQELHVVPETKLADLRNRTVDKDALPCIIPVVGATELNSKMWQEWKKNLSMNSCKFLIDAQEVQDRIENDGSYYSMESSDYAKMMAPYVETAALVHEAINLDKSYKNELLKLTEPPSGTKDKAVAASYGNYIISLIENQWAKFEQEEEIGAEDWCLVF